MAQDTPASKIIRGRRRAAAYTGLGPTQVWLLERKGDFPRAVPLSARARGYLVAELDRWLAGRAAQRDGGAQ
jgi:predicted DNA-binding transcriptional regulator AlpA